MEVLPVNNIREKIYTLRHVEVMLDLDLAKLYDVETKRINEAVNRNPENSPMILCLSVLKMSGKS